MKTKSTATTAAAGALAVAFALAGCSGTDDEQNQGGGEQSQAAETTAPAGESSDDDTGDDTGDDVHDDAGEQSSAPAEGSGGLAPDADLSSESPSVSPEDAISAAQKEAGNGTVHAIELDYDRRDAAWQYEVKILKDSTDHDISIDAETGEVVDTEKDSTDDKEGPIDLTDPLSFDDALNLAADKSGGRLTSWKLEHDDGRAEYQFDFDDNGEDTEVTVDVDSKKVTVDDD
ncbi:MULTISPECIES: PepSY domain-containing protein [unclassified Brevibacterium]|uniref:PepSY domain-containing protein n=1 Tax=unclassified Brevibacterium TaxID=2614124 RepID=UPI001E4A0D11|nr:MULTISPECIES: PepSY domain-containing protein [unclassified Brevibacterium]MCD1284518.1 peptidase [Brevibacterium sp. CCUG 69071]MDK8435864.1 PepSY domain-containing protein [Brevibacterium sp. H-BE7]